MLLPLPGGPETPLLLLLAVLLDAAVGDARLLARLLPAPADLVRRVAGWADRRLNRIDRSDGVRRLRGVLVVLALLPPFVAVGVAAAVVARLVPYGWVLELLLLLRCLSVRAGWVGMDRVRAALLAGGVEAGRSAVAPITDRQVWSLDAHGVVRAAVEAGALTLVRGVVAPIFWYVLLGLPGALAWTTAAALVATIGPPTPRHARFGRAARTLAAAMGLLPALLAALCIALAALFLPRQRPWSALRAGFAADRGHPIGTLARPVAAVAGALDLALGGPRREGDLVVREPWLGEGRARALPRDLGAAMALYSVVTLLLLGLAVAQTFLH